MFFSFFTIYVDLFYILLAPSEYFSRVYIACLILMRCILNKENLRLVLTGEKHLFSLIEQEAKRQPAMEYIIRDDQGNLVTIVQGVEPVLTIGQRVFVQEGRSGRGRVIPAT